MVWLGAGCGRYCRIMLMLMVRMSGCRSRIFCSRIYILTYLLISDVFVIRMVVS